MRGGFWPSRVDDWGNNKLKSDGIYGLKGGVFINWPEVTGGWLLSRGER
jgi:hypothetical protein